MGRVVDILRAKGAQIYSIRSDVSVYEAVRAMVSHNVGSLLVLDDDEVKGIVTERDYLREIVLKGRTSKTTLVGEIMTTEVVAIEPNLMIEECMAVMTERRIRHLPVVENGALVGLISIGDLVKQIASDREVEIRYLTDYITGKYPA
jgi:signal-transduction protein with cAMP-binding, CBS, and nucleotidyltransferase domain